MNEIELRHSRLRLAEVLKDNSFVYNITPQTVSRLTNKGFKIGGELGARFTTDKGLVIWNRGQRNTGTEFSVNELVNLENELKKEFEDIWKTDS